MEAIAAPVRECVRTCIRRCRTGMRAEWLPLIEMPESFMTAYRPEIISLAARHRLPNVCAYRFFAELGGLLSCGKRPDR
jgi:hypothetical protein